MKIFDFINHASFRCQYNGLSLITDPWYVSNAFANWYQYPSPVHGDIFDLIDEDERLGVIVSHGHDDHCDDWFITNHLKDKLFFCSKFATPGLERRLDTKLNVNTKPIDNGITFGDFSIRQFVNPDFTEYDAVITIETNEFVIIHANDNWHKWPHTMMEPIAKLAKKHGDDRTFYLSQFGIADCFPLNYPDISREDAEEIIEKRFQSYKAATLSNMKGLGLSQIYLYANQSRYDYPNETEEGFSLYDQAVEFIADSSEVYTQLIPGMSVYAGHEVQDRKDGSISLFEYCRVGLENFLNKNLHKIKDRNARFPIKLCTSTDQVVNDAVCYVAPKALWNRIFIGELNLEAIIVGGSGTIHKPNYNISAHHHFVSKQSYIVQNLISRLGLSFFREHNS